MTLEVLGTTIKHHIVAAEKHQEKQESHFKSAGIYLIEARDRVKAGEYESPHFSHFLVQYAKMSPSRAYELIAIADGTKTVESIREAVNERYARNKPNAMSSDTNEVVDSIGKNVGKPKNLGGRPPVDELAHLRSQITKQLKSKSKEQLVLILQMVGGI